MVDAACAMECSICHQTLNTTAFYDHVIAEECTAINSNEEVEVDEETEDEVQEEQELVRRALSELSDEFRQAIVLTEIEGLSYEDAAEAVGCPIGTIRSRIHRARNELREKLRILLKEPQSDGNQG